MEGLGRMTICMTGGLGFMPSASILASRYDSGSDQRVGCRGQDGPKGL